MSRGPDSDAEELARRWVSQYGDLALRTAYLMLGDRGLAEDCVQEALVRAWRARSTLRDPAAERSWLLTIVANTGRSQLRRRVPVPSDRAPQERAAADPFAELDLAVELRQALDLLPPEQREVVVMRLYLDLSVEETARSLRVAEGTVKSRLSRALGTIRKSWTPSSS